MVTGPQLPAERKRHLHPLTEVAVAFLMLVVVERYGVGGSIGFVGMEPNPLWLPIVWGAVRGGLFIGLATAVTAATLHAIGYAALTGPGWSLLVDPAVTWPLLVFSLIAFTVGQIRDTIDTDRRQARQETEGLRRDAVKQRADIELLHHVNHELKRRIFDRSFDFQSVMSTVAQTHDASDEQAFETPLGMLVDFCGATKCSALYVLPGGVIDLAAQRGWTDEEMHDRLRVTRNNQRVLRAVVEARPIVALDDADVEAGGALLVAPLADSTGVIKALLCIDELPPTRFDDNTVKTFLGVASWVANNLRRIELGGASEETWQSVMQVLNASKSIGTPQQLSERLFLEDSRRNRYNVECVLVGLRLLDSRSGMAEYAETLEGYVAQVVSSSIRLTDDAYRFGFAGCYVIVMAGCQTEHAGTVIERLTERFAAHSGSDLGPVRLELFAPDQDAPSLGALLPRVTNFFFGEHGDGIAHRCPVPEPARQRSGNATDFVRRLRLEMDLAKRQEWDLHLADFRGGEKEFGIGPMMARHLWNLAGTMLRVTDGIYVLGPTRCVVLLPCTSALDATRIWQRLHEELAKSIPDGRYESVRTEFLALTGTDAQDALSHLVGGPSLAEVARPDPVLSDVELDQLSFSDTEFTAFQGFQGFDGDSGIAEALDAALPDFDPKTDPVEGHPAPHTEVFGDEPSAPAAPETAAAAMQPTSEPEPEPPADPFASFASEPEEATDPPAELDHAPPPRPQPTPEASSPAASLPAPPASTRPAIPTLNPAPNPGPQAEPPIRRNRRSRRRPRFLLRPLPTRSFPRDAQADWALAALRDETRANHAELRAEIGAMREAMRSDLAELLGELLAADRDADDVPAPDLPSAQAPAEGAPTERTPTATSDDAGDTDPTADANAARRHRRHLRRHRRRGRAARGTDVPRPAHAGRHGGRPATRARRHLRSNQRTRGRRIHAARRGAPGHPRPNRVRAVRTGGQGSARGHGRRHRTPRSRGSGATAQRDRRRGGLGPRDRRRRCRHPRRGATAVAVARRAGRPSRRPPRPRPEPERRPRVSKAKFARNWPSCSDSPAPVPAASPRTG